MKIIHLNILAGIILLNGCVYSDPVIVRQSYPVQTYSEYYTNSPGSTIIIERSYQPYYVPYGPTYYYGRGNGYPYPQHYHNNGQRPSKPFPNPSGKPPKPQKPTK